MTPIDLESLRPQVQRVTGSTTGTLYADVGRIQRHADSDQWIEYVPAPPDTPAPIGILERLVQLGPDKIRQLADFIAPAPVKCKTCRDDPRGELIDCDGSAGYRKCTSCGAERA